MTPKTDFSLSCNVWSASAEVDGSLTVRVRTLTDSSPLQVTKAFVAREQPQRISVIGSAPGAERCKVYTIPVLSAGNYGVEVKLGTLPDSVVEWYADGQLVALDDDGGEGLGSRLVMHLEPGVYFALVRGWQIGQYGTFTIQFGGVETTQESTPLFPSSELSPSTANSYPYADNGSEPYTISGSVRGTNGLPVAGVQVIVPETTLGAETDERGRFLIRNIPAGFSGQVAVEQTDGLVLPATRSFSAPTCLLDFDLLRSVGTLQSGERLEGSIEDFRSLAEGFVVSATENSWIGSSDYALLVAEMDFRDFSPNEDGVRDFCTLTYQLSEDATTEVIIRDLDGHLVRQLRSPTLANMGSHRVMWDGTDYLGESLPEDTYLIQIVVRDKESVQHSLDFCVSINRSFFFHPANSADLANRLLLGAWFR
ncbi:MAG TPA: FlgD immunoglobulin-like domain containing protein, partial [bacterium]|nr:FlgD immunoglobulin-like domain containing protein [bacterium]